MADRERLLALVADRNTPAKVVWRAKIILATADGLGTMAIMRATGKQMCRAQACRAVLSREGALLHPKTAPRFREARPAA